MEIPIVIIHFGNQEYFQECVRINSLHNKVYLIGDMSNKYCENDKIQHINYEILIDDEIRNFKKKFTNYSSNAYIFELNCYLRIFYLQKVMKLYNIDYVFHLDSDCIVFENIYNILSLSIPNIINSKTIAYSKNHSNNPYHMVGCVHNALLNMEFCNKFIELCFDIYVNKSKYNLIESKINWHKSNKIAGGICDMTLYYLLYSENIISNVYDLNTINNNTNNTTNTSNTSNPETNVKCTFDHNINNSYGYLGDDTYIMLNNLKKLSIINHKPYVFDKTGNIIRLLSIHFSGGAKQILKLFYKHLME